MGLRYFNPTTQVHVFNEFLVRGIRLVPTSVVSELCFLYGRVHMSTMLSALGFDTYTVSQRISLESFTVPPHPGISRNIFCFIGFNNTWLEKLRVTSRRCRGWQWVSCCFKVGCSSPEGGSICTSFEHFFFSLHLCTQTYFFLLTLKKHAQYFPVIYYKCCCLEVFKLCLGVVHYESGSINFILLEGDYLFIYVLYFSLMTKIFSFFYLYTF